MYAPIHASNVKFTTWSSKGWLANPFHYTYISNVPFGSVLYIASYPHGLIIHSHPRIGTYLRASHFIYARKAVNELTLHFRLPYCFS